MDQHRSPRPRRLSLQSSAVAGRRKNRQLRAHMIRIIGSFVSPYVRKVLACMNLKGLRYEVDPITPFFGNDEFAAPEPASAHPGAGRRRFLDQRSARSSAPISTRPIPAIRCSRRPEGPRPRPLARGIRRHAARRPLHLGPVLPEDRPSAGLGRARRPGADREDARPRTFPPRSIISSASCPRTASCSARSASPTSRSPASSATALMRASRSTPRAGREPPASSSAPSPIRLRRVAAVRGCAAQRRDQGPAPGAARCGRAAHRGDAGAARAARGMMRL